jgi:hypothetical protein
VAVYVRFPSTDTQSCGQPGGRQTAARRLAEDAGFEPARGYQPQHDFQSCAIGQLGESSAEEDTRLLWWPTKR